MRQLRLSVRLQRHRSLQWYEMESGVIEGVCAGRLCVCVCVIEGVCVFVCVCVCV